MYILSLHGKEGEGAYAVTNDDGHKALYLFEQEDDATRYAGLLDCLLYTSPSPRDRTRSRMPSSA